MADLSITATSVVSQDSTRTVLETGTAGATITAGQAVYRDTADSNKLKLAKANTAASAAIRGVALHAATNNQPLRIQRAGPITIGATTNTGTIYICSDTAAGGIAPHGDLATGWFTSTLGIATNTTTIEIQIQNGGVAKA